MIAIDFVLSGWMSVFAEKDRPTQLPCMRLVQLDREPKRPQVLVQPSQDLITGQALDEVHCPNRAFVLLEDADDLHHKRLRRLRSWKCRETQMCHDVSFKARPRTGKTTTASHSSGKRPPLTSAAAEVGCVLVPIFRTAPTYDI